MKVISNQGSTWLENIRSETEDQQAPSRIASDGMKHKIFVSYTIAKSECISEMLLCELLDNTYWKDVREEYKKMERCYLCYGYAKLQLKNIFYMRHRGIFRESKGRTT